MHFYLIRYPVHLVDTLSIIVCPNKKQDNVIVREKTIDSIYKVHISTKTKKNINNK
jgi:uncharacterized protein YbaR (Trm112 family)